MKCLVTELFNQAGVDVFEKNGVEVTLAYGKSMDELKEMVKDYEILVVRAATPVQNETKSYRYGRYRTKSYRCRICKKQ